MKNVKRIFVLFLTSFLLTVSVNASLSCDIRIEETNIDPAGFDVMMPICVYKDYPDHPAGYNEVTHTGSDETDPLRRRTSYEDAYASGLEMVNYAYTAETADGKDVYERTGSVPVCSTSLRKVIAHSTCVANISRAPIVNRCSTKDQYSCGNYSQCYWNPSDNKCMARREGNDVISATCNDGLSLTDDSVCVGTASYTFEKEVSSNVSRTEIERECMRQTGGYSCSCSAPSTVNSTSYVEYALVCPYYECEPEEVEVGACTPNFQIDGQPAYCVNPSQRFTGQFQHDTEFNVRECANSYSTVECGYANILIEGAYHSENGGISDDAINLALRLWSYHTNRIGFEKSGLANLMGDACSQGVYFMSEGADNHKRNVYAETHKYIMETARRRFYDIAQSKIERTGYLPDYIEPAETSRAKFTGATFEQITCEGTRGVTCGSNPTYRVAFELFFNTLIGNKYMLAHLDDLYGDDEIAVPTGATLIDNPEDPNEGKWIAIDFERTDFERAMGDREEILCDESDPDYDKIKKYCKVKVTTYDENGNVIDDEQEAEKCLKSFGCISVTKVVAYCTPTVTGYKIKEIQVKYTNPRSSMSVRKYTACGDMSNTQEMYAFFPETIPGRTDQREIVKKHFFPGYSCEDGCTSYDTRVENQTGSCNLNDNNYDTSYKKTVKDPSLGCIVNMASEDKKRLYDFSDIFGVNTNFCRIYCSDEIEYNLADKTKAFSGRTFTYDVKENRSAYERDYKFAAVVKEKRSCVSEIYYDRLPSNVDWKQIYGLTTDEFEELRDINEGGLTWSHLFNIIYKKSQNESGRTENLNQMVYDLYNCNLYADFPDNVYQPRNNTVGNVLENIKEMFTLDNGFTNIGNFNDTISYTTGANISTYDEHGEGSSQGAVGVDPNDIKTGVAFNDNSSQFGFKGVKYCTGLDCLHYNAQREEYDYSSINGRSNVIDEPNHGYKYPINSYAYFEINNEINYYNNDRFQVIPGSGSVVKGTANPLLYALDEYSFPLDKNAYNNSTCTKTDDGKIFCPVTQTLNISTYRRATVSDPLQTEIRNNTFKCYVEVDVPEVNVCPDNDTNCYEKRATYRNVDPSNLFPNNVDVPDNWDTDEGREAREQIESTADLLKTTNDLLEYSITLNPDQIAAVREYNRRNGGYTNERVFGCDPLNDDGYYTNCKSAFLDALRGNNYDYPDPTVLGTFNEPYTTGVSAYNGRN